MKKDYFSVFRVNKQVLIPALFMSQAGYLSQEPVAVHDVSDEQGIINSIVAELELDRGTMSLPSTRAGYGTPVVVARAGLKSWNALEKNGRTWWAEHIGGRWHLHAPRTNAKGKWEADPAADETLPGDIPLDQLARRVVELVKGAKS